MKKQMKWLLAALAIAALATPAFAVTADMTGTLAVRAIATNNLDGNDNAQDHSRGMDQRFRLFTSVAANENVKAVLGLEVDNVFGRTAAGTGTPTTYAKDLGAMGTDDAGKLEIKHLYLDFKVPALGASVKAGSQPFNFGRGMVINDDAAGLAFSMPCKVNPDNKIDLVWVKTSEGTTVNTKDDGDFYGAKYSLKAAGVGIAPYAGYYTAGAAALTGNNVDAAFIGVDVDGKAADITYALTAIYNNWNATAVAGTATGFARATDGSSISLFAKGTMAMGDTTLSLEAARMGDVDNAGGNSMSLAQNAATGPIVNISEILTGGMYTANSTVSTNVGGAATLYQTNWLYAKVGAVQKLNDSMKASVYLAHIAQASDVKRATTTDAITYGQEVDAYFDYTIVPGLGLNVAAAYLLADSDFGAGDDAWKLATSLNYKF